MFFSSNANFSLISSQLFLLGQKIVLKRIVLKCIGNEKAYKILHIMGSNINSHTFTVKSGEIRNYKDLMNVLCV